MTESKEPLLNTDAEKEEGKGDEDRFAIAYAAGGVQMLCETNDQMMSTFLAAYFMEHGLNRADVGKAYFAISVGFLLAYPITQVLLKKFPANMVQYYGSFGFIAIRFALGFLMFVPDEWLFTLLVALFLILGMVAMVIESAGSTWVMLSVQPQDRVDAMGRLMQTRVSGNIIAPIFGGTLYSIGGFGTPMFVGAIMFLVYMIVKRKALLSSVPREAEAGDQTGTILKNKMVLLGVTMFFLTILLMFSGQVWQFPFLHFNCGLPIWVCGFVGSYYVIPFAVGAVFINTMQTKFGYFEAMVLLHSLHGSFHSHLCRLFGSQLSVSPLAISL